MTVDVVALQADVDSLTSELLNRYEEVTLLYDLASEMGVVVDVASAAATALNRSLQVIRAHFGVVFIGTAADELHLVAHSGDPGAADSRHRLAAAVARLVLRQPTLLIAHAGERVPGLETGLDEAVLASCIIGAAVTASTDPQGVIVYIGPQDDERFSAAEAQLSRVVAGQLGRGMENAQVINELREKERLESDLNAAAEIQRSLLPRRPPVVRGANLSAECLPATKVGGDYYDFFTAPNGDVNIVVADVTGHGLGPGLIMAMTRSVLRAELRRADSLVEALSATNAVMWDDLVATDIFITLFVARYDQDIGRLRYVNGGHQPALIRRRDGSTVELTSEGMPLGLVPTPIYEEETVDLYPDETVLVYSDGVVEAESPRGELFGEARLREAVSEAVVDTAEEMVSVVLDQVSRFRGSDIQDDDVTIVALHIASDRPSWSAR